MNYIVKGTKKIIVGVVMSLSLVACAGQTHITAIDYADVGTTAVGLTIDGISEANPIVGVLGDGAAPFVAMGIKYASKKWLIANGYTPCEADKKVGTVSAFGTANNVVAILGASTPVGIAAGVIGAMIYNSKKQCYSEETFTLTVTPDTKFVDVE